MLQRKTTRMGAGLGRTTGWIHRARLKAAEVRMLTGIAYEAIVPEGITIRDTTNVDREPRLIEADTIVLCAGQVSERALCRTLAGRHPNVHLVGGADIAAELDARRAIDQATRLAARL